MQTFRSTSALTYRKTLVPKDAFGFSLFFSSGGEGEAETKGRRPDIRSPRKRSRVDFQSFSALSIPCTEHAEVSFVDDSGAHRDSTRNQAVPSDSNHTGPTFTDIEAVSKREVHPPGSADTIPVPPSVIPPAYDGTFVFGTRWRLESDAGKEVGHKALKTDQPFRPMLHQEPAQMVKTAEDTSVAIEPCIPFPSLGDGGLEDSDQTVLRECLKLFRFNLRSHTPH
jgi:hypothetical protein